MQLNELLQLHLEIVAIADDQERLNHVISYGSETVEIKGKKKNGKYISRAYTYNSYPNLSWDRYTFIDAEKDRKFVLDVNYESDRITYRSWYHYWSGKTVSITPNRFLRELEKFQERFEDEVLSLDED